MKTTLNIPDDLFRVAKVKAAQEGVKLKDLIAEGLRLVISGNVHGRSHRVKFPLITGKAGGLVLTEEHVRQAEEAELQEETKQYAKFMRR